MICHIFCEPVPGRVAHTISSASLLKNTSVRDWLDMTFEEWGPASVKAADAFAKYPGSQEPNETGFGLAFEGQTIFQFLGQRPERAKVFGSAMGNFSKGVSHKVEHLVEGYDWNGLGKGTVVDVWISSSRSLMAVSQEDLKRLKHMNTYRSAAPMGTSVSQSPTPHPTSVSSCKIYPIPPQTAKDSYPLHTNLALAFSGMT